MTAHNPPAHRRTDHSTDGQLPGTRETLSVSTRFLIDAASWPACHTCGQSIEARARYRCLTVREGDGTVRELSLCSEECLSTATGSRT